MRGQTSVEFLILLGFMLLVFGSFFVLAERLFEEAHKDVITFGMEEVASTVENELILAAQVRDGYSRVFTIPYQVAEQPVSVQIQDGEDLVVNTSLYEYLIFLPFNVSIDESDYGILSRENLIIKNSTGIFIQTLS